MADEKKGITVKIDAALHAEIREYLERHEEMTMAEFITLAVDDELHPKKQQGVREKASPFGLTFFCCSLNAGSLKFPKISSASSGWKIFSSRGTSWLREMDFF